MLEAKIFSTESIDQLVAATCQYLGQSFHLQTTWTCTPQPAYEFFVSSIGTPRSVVQLPTAGLSADRSGNEAQALISETPVRRTVPIWARVNPQALKSLLLRPTCYQAASGETTYNQRHWSRHSNTIDSHCSQDMAPNDENLGKGNSASVHTAPTSVIDGYEDWGLKVELDALRHAIRHIFDPSKLEGN